MDIQTATTLNRMNARFYQQHADSFSSTRHGSWAGWEKALDCAGITSMPSHVVDVACGNLRFEDYLAQRFPQQVLAATGIDNCCELHELSRAAGGASIVFQETDVVSELLAGHKPQIPAGDLIVCFGFMHHIPTAEMRKELLNAMYDALNPGGTLIASFWQFMTVDTIAKQALEITSQCDLELDEGDYILGWQNSSTARRYCHSFDSIQVRQLSPTPDAEIFEADGRNGRLNVYLVCRKAHS